MEPNWVRCKECGPSLTGANTAMKTYQGLIDDCSNREGNANECTVRKGVTSVEDPDGVLG